MITTGDRNDEAMSARTTQSGSLLSRVIISTNDLERSLGIYRDVLGYQGDPTGDVAMLTNGSGPSVMLHQRPATPSDTAVAAAFVVADLDRTIEGWTSAGGSVLDPPASQPWGERMAVVRDTDGHIVCLIDSEASAHR